MRELVEDSDTELVFSAASIWEVAIKNGLGRRDFRVDPRLLRLGLLESGYIEMPVTGEHAASVDILPHTHKDTFDRILITQALIEGISQSQPTLSSHATRGQFGRFDAVASSLGLVTP